MKLCDYRAPMPAAEYVRSILDYDPASGRFVWKSGKARARFIGKQAGTINAFGYITIKIDGRDYYAHRLAYVHVNGDVLNTEMDVDHKNRNRADNRIANLRRATRTENIVNSKGRKRHRHRLPRGVVRDGNKFSANIRVNNRRHYLGYHDTAGAAHQAYLAAAKRFHGEFAETI